MVGSSLPREWSAIYRSDGLPPTGHPAVFQHTSLMQRAHSAKWIFGYVPYEFPSRQLFPIFTNSNRGDMVVPSPLERALRFRLRCLLPWLWKCQLQSV